MVLKVTCMSKCDSEAAAGKEKCGDDAECMDKVNAIYKKCGASCECSDQSCPRTRILIKIGI